MIVSKQIGNPIEDAKKFEAIMNAANGIGPMGAGIAGAIRKAGGEVIEKQAFEVCKENNPKAGGAYMTKAGKLPVKAIIHAVTMKQPGGETSLEIVEKAFRSALNLAEFNQIKSIGCTALGTGVGGLDPVKVAKVMTEVAQDSKVYVSFYDFDPKFIGAIRVGEEETQFYKHVLQ